MTNPEREELVKLADRLAALPTFKMPTVVTVPGVACNARERDLIVTALRRLASSEDAVKGKPEPVALSASERACYLWPDDTEQARACRAAYIDGAKDYTVPPAGAGMREAVRRLEELDCLYVNGERYPFGGIVGDPETAIRREAIKECIAALTAPGATTKSDGPASQPQLVATDQLAGANTANGPSDPSSTRSDVAASVRPGVLSAIRSIYGIGFGTFAGGYQNDSIERAADKIVALLETHEIRRRP